MLNLVVKCCSKALEEAAMEVVSMQKDKRMDCSAAFVLAIEASLKRPLLEALGRKEEEAKEEEVDCSCSLCPVARKPWQIPRKD